MEWSHEIPTTWGKVQITGRDSLLSRLHLFSEACLPLKVANRSSTPWLADLSQAIQDYFNGYRVQFVPHWSDIKLTAVYERARSWWQDKNPAWITGAYNIEVPLDLAVPPTSQQILAAAAAIPYGCTISYGELSQLLYGNRNYARAVGSAMRINPLPLIIPCHRVTAKSGPGGFSGGLGLPTKLQMLKLESR